MSEARAAAKPRLPSMESATALVKGEPGAAAEVAFHLAGRAVLIGLGLALAGERRGIVKKAFFGALSIEVFVIGYAALNVKKEKSAAAAAASAS